jgi:ribosomal protein L35AE/L33A
MLEFRGSREAAEFINRKLEEGWKKKKEGKGVRGNVNEREGKEGEDRNKDLAGRSRRI